MHITGVIKNMKNKKTTYKDSGVDRDAGNRAVDLIKKEVQKTFRHYEGEVLSGIGGFSGVVELKDKRVMGMSTDGVGTKLFLSIILKKYDTVGIDLVAMCVNDLIVAGVYPAFFLDYIALGKQEPEKTQLVIKGIIKGCDLAECALIGGEMAEMPGMYRKEDYDLAGFSVGFAESKKDIISGEKIKPGMKVYGFPSSGVHSNGYSLIRKIFKIDFENPSLSKKNLNVFYPELGKTLGEELLTPTTIYVKLVKKLIKKYNIAGLIHITGGGVIENPPRILPEGCALEIKESALMIPPIFEIIKEKGNISSEEMMRTFNCGIGLMAISENKIKEGVFLGEVVEGDRKVFIK